MTEEQKKNGPWTWDDMKRLTMEACAAMPQIPAEKRPYAFRDADYCWHPSYSDQAYIGTFGMHVKVLWRDGELASGVLGFSVEDGRPEIAICDDDQVRFDMHGVYTLDGEEV